MSCNAGSLNVTMASDAARVLNWKTSTNMRIAGRTEKPSCRQTEGQTLGWLPGRAEAT